MDIMDIDSDSLQAFLLQNPHALAAAKSILNNKLVATVPNVANAAATVAIVAADEAEAITSLMMVSIPPASGLDGEQRAAYSSALWNAFAQPLTEALISANVNGADIVGRKVDMEIVFDPDTNHKMKEIMRELLIDYGVIASRVPLAKSEAVKAAAVDAFMTSISLTRTRTPRFYDSWANVYREAFLKDPAVNDARCDVCDACETFWTHHFGRMATTLTNFDEVVCVEMCDRLRIKYLDLREPITGDRNTLSPISSSGRVSKREVRLGDS